MAIQKEIPFDSELHKAILEAICKRHALSKKKMQERYEEWSKAEKDMVAYLPAKDAEVNAVQAREGNKFVQVKIPYTYAMVLAAHTYWTSVFLNRSPILQVNGIHGEAKQKSLAHDALLMYQVNTGKQIPVYYTWLLDVAKYGVGFTGTYWHKEEFILSSIIEEEVTVDGIAVPGKTQKKKRNERMTGYEGNKNYNIRPFDFFPDPRVPLRDFQMGEFCGRTTSTGWNNIIKREKQGIYMNIAALRNNLGGASSQSFYDQNDALVETSKFDLLTPTMKDKDTVVLLEMTVEIIPKDWKLGGSDYPEKWVFTVANDKVIIGAQPLGLAHNKFPFSVIENEVDGYGFSSRGFFKIANPLSNTMDWLANTHFFNVEAAVNNEYIYDPTMISTKDFLDPSPGKRIRLKPAAYGRDITKFVHQLNQVDHTQQNLRDMQVIEGLFQRIFGINDQILGALPQGGRVTATASRQAAGFGVNRLKSSAEFFSITGWSEMTQMFIQNNQQLYTDEKVFKIAGSNFQEGADTIKVTPEALAGFYDFVPVDGTLPVDRFAQAQLWRDIFTNMRNMPPDIAATYDTAAMFGWFAKLAGANNIDQFKRSGVLPQGAQPAQIAPNASLAQEAKAGNVVPINEV